jgi:ribonuclease Z
VASVGFIVYDVRRKLKEEYQGLPGEKIRDLRQAGEEVTHEVRFPIVCYTGDTSSEGLDNHPDVYKAKILITEMTFFRPEHRKDKIRKFGHMHLDDILEREDKFENELIIVSHFSTRYGEDHVRRALARKIPKSMSEKLQIWL